MAKGTVLDALNIERQTVEDLAERLKRVVALVKQHRDNEKEQKKKEKDEAKAANKAVIVVAKPAPTLEQRQT